MKNLKRVLSLGLASVMLLGMMVMGASATGKDFTDADKIVNGEAVQVLVALGIVNGKEDGSYFDPEGTVTRGEMAKMIAVAMNGGSEANTGVKGTPTFTDIGGHWAEGWIEYCVDMGIISGRGDGTFDPNGLVTGTEALKMVLSAMGYDATAYKLEGAGWAAQTMENARKTKPVNLTENLDDIVMTQSASRDTAAQMIWNGLQSYIVDISPDKNTNTGETTWSYETQTGTTLLKQRYKANVATATFNGNSDYSLKGSPASDEITVLYREPSTDKEGNVTYTDRVWNFPADIDIDYIGEEVKVVWKDGAKSTNKNAPDKNDTIFGVFVTDGTRVERTTMDKVKDQKTGKAQINLNGTVCDVADTVTVVTNFGAATKTFGDGKDKDHTALKSDYKKVDADNDGKTDKDEYGQEIKELIPGVYGTDQTATANATNSGLTAYLKQKNGAAIKAVFNDNNKVDKIFITESQIASVSSINNTNVALNSGIGTVKLADNEVEEGLKKGDVVTILTYYKAKASDAGAYSVVKKAEKVTGEVEAFGISTTQPYQTTNITLSGKKYTTKEEQNLIKVEDSDKYVQDFNTNDTKNTYIGKDFDLYLVDGFVGAAVKVSADADNYSVITEVKDSGKAGATFSNVQLQVMGADGTKEIITVSKESDDLKTRKPKANATAANDITYDDYAVGDIITYSFDKDDYAEVTVEGKVKKAATNLTYSDNNKKVAGYPTTADCLFFAQVDGAGSVDPAGKLTSDGDPSWEAYHIRDLGDIKLLKDAAYTVATNKDGKAVAVFMDLKDTPEGASDDTVYGVISGYNGRVADYYSFTVQSNGETYEIKTKKNTNLEKGKLVRFRPTADGTYGSNSIKVYAASSTGKDNKLVIDAKNIGWVDEYSSRDNTLTYWFGSKMGKDESGNYTKTTGLSKETYALAKDAVIVYVDVNGSKSESEGSVDHWSEYTGRPNVMFTTKVVEDEEVINVMFVETSTRADVNKNVK